MIRSLRQAPTKLSSLAADAGERAHADMLVLKEMVTALCDRVEILEAQVLLARPLVVARGQR